MRVGSLKVWQPGSCPIKPDSRVDAFRPGAEHAVRLAAYESRTGAVTLA
jgi:hypothetical protein